MGGLWSAYFNAVSGGGRGQQEIAKKVGVSQATVSRWSNGGPGDSGANVAAFCRAFGRSPIEGFVAAGLLTEQEAGRSLTKREREFLAQLRGDPDMAVYRQAGAERKSDRGDTPRSRRGA